MLSQKRHRVRFDRMSDQCSQTGAGDLDIPPGKSLAQKIFCRWTAADVPDAENQNFLEHVERPLRLWPEAITRASHAKADQPSFRRSAFLDC